MSGEPLGPVGSIDLADEYLREIFINGSPHDVTRLLLTVLAYPEFDKEQERILFFENIHNYYVWSQVKEFGLGEVRRRYEYVPTKRSIETKLNRGLKRINRRMVAYDFITERLISARLGKGYSINGIESVPLIPRGSGSRLQAYVGRASLNVEKNSLDFLCDIDDLKKDFRRRVLNPSIPVMHIAFGVYFQLVQINKKFRQNNLLNLIMIAYHESSSWYEVALNNAIEFYEKSSITGYYGPVSQENLIKISIAENVQKLHFNAP